jgi:hypothetical protein
MNMKPLVQKSFLLLLLQVVVMLLQYPHGIYQRQGPSPSAHVVHAPGTNTPKQPLEPDRCAINLFGLPRAFRSLTLPSLIKNVIAVNADCDYFVHYYQVTQEAGQGRCSSSLCC